ncbi:MAG TPA: hypothetical protein VF941_01185 [Clostridia bacterium]
MSNNENLSILEELPYIEKDTLSEDAKLSQIEGLYSIAVIREILELMF